MTIKQIYLANDNSGFLTEKEAEDHNAILTLTNTLSEILRRKADWNAVGDKGLLAVYMINSAKTLLDNMTEIQSILQRVPANNPDPLEMKIGGVSIRKFDYEPNGFEDVHLQNTIDNPATNYGLYIKQFCK